VGLAQWKFYRCFCPSGKIVVGVKNSIWCMTWANFRDTRFTGFAWVSIEEREYFHFAEKVPLIYVLLKMPDMVQYLTAHEELSKEQADVTF